MPGHGLCSACRDTASCWERQHLRAEGGPMPDLPAARRRGRPPGAGAGETDRERTRGETRAARTDEAASQALGVRLDKIIALLEALAYMDTGYICDKTVYLRDLYHAAGIR